jgi:uncharacterized cupin superfamily protein
MMADWFVVNVRDTSWDTHEKFGSRCRFESPDAPFPQLGINLRVLEPGQPNGLYHCEPAQEDFLVLAGECVLLVEGMERRLGAWDFVHCPPDTEHVFVGAGDRPCILLMVGARPPGLTYHYPVSGLAQRYEAGVAEETDDWRAAYAPYPGLEEERPRSWSELPWA